MAKLEVYTRRVGHWQTFQLSGRCEISCCFCGNVEATVDRVYPFSAVRVKAALKSVEEENRFCRRCGARMQRNELWKD